jgi:hypothetical protein
MAHAQPTTGALAPQTLASQTDWNASVFVALYSKLAVAFGVTPQQLDAGATSAPQQLLVISDPGAYIPSGMDPVNAVADRAALAAFCDGIPQFRWVAQPAPGTISGVYRSILDDEQAPLVSLDPTQAKKLSDAEATYAKYGSDYDTYRALYLAALDNYLGAYATFLNGGPPIPRSLQLQLKAALDKWDRNGHRMAVDAALAVMTQYQPLAPQTFWPQMRQQFDAATEVTPSGDAFQPVDFTPPYKAWFTDQGWTSFTFGARDLDNQRRSEAIGVAGVLDPSFGLLNVSPSGDYRRDATYIKLDAMALDWSCSLTRVTLERSWMNARLFASRAWRWTPGSSMDGTLLSSGGDIFDDIAPSGVMTLVPSALLLAKNLRVTGTFDSALVDQLNQRIAANESVGLGPFAIAGQLAMRAHGQSVRGSIATTGITAAGVQCIALICDLLPKSPDPDGVLPWPP